MSDEESTKNPVIEGAVVAVEDNGWKKEGSCKVAVQLQPPHKVDPTTNKLITTEEVDGFKWTKTKDGKDFELHLPVGVTPSQHGVDI